MSKKNIYTWRLPIGILAMLMVMVMASCGGESEEAVKSPAVLTVYVYPPQRPIATRGEGIEGQQEEYNVGKLQIWLFEHETGNKVAYLDADVSLLNNTNHSAAYDLVMPEWFIVEKPNVDVYVFANVTTGNAGVAYGETDSRETLNNATLNNNFGLTSQGGYPVAKLPADGIPMTGVLTNHGGPALTITDISMDAGMIPEKEYLVMAAPLIYRVGTDYNKSVGKFIGSSIAVTTSNESPSQYVIGLEDAQTYNDRIMEAVGDGKLTAKGPFYLRESDKQITGTLTYKVGEDSPKTAAFSMAKAGDFARNHSWIVYAYYTAGDILTVSSVAVDDWVSTPDIDYLVPNW